MPPKTSGKIDSVVNDLSTAFEKNTGGILVLPAKLRNAIQHVAVLIEYAIEFDETHMPSALLLVSRVFLGNVGAKCTETIWFVARQRDRYTATTKQSLGRPVSIDNDKRVWPG
jgi:hypothetical protein